MTQKEIEKPLSSDRPVVSSADGETLVQAFREELKKLRDLDSPERTPLYERAEKIGVRFIRGDEQ